MPTQIKLMSLMISFFFFLVDFFFIITVVKLQITPFKFGQNSIQSSKFSFVSIHFFRQVQLVDSIKLIY
jgi:hypothetical protein